MYFKMKDMRKIAIVICNYNGGMDTVNCVKAVFKSTFQDYDIFVADNASEDDSVELLNNHFGERVNILRNKENLGGSGGFGRGIRHAVECGYEFIMMLDNDAFIDTDTVETFYTYLCEHEDVGIVGAKIMSVEQPEVILDFAKNMDWEHFHDGSKWMGQRDCIEACVPVECDYVAATAAMATRKALMASGGMDEEHFIYYDDIEMNQRIRMAGFKVVCLGTTKAWHKSSMAHRKTNTFTRYYLTRNRYRFFAKYLPEERLDEFAEYILNESFVYMYGSFYMGREDVFESSKYILKDFIEDVRGKAGLGRVVQLHSNYPDNIRKLVSAKKRVGVYRAPDGNMASVEKLIGIIRGIDETIDVELINDIDEGEYDLRVWFCEHVKDQKRNILPAVYIDNHNNIVDDWNAYLYFQNYDNSFQWFKRLYKEDVLSGIKKIREY